MGDGHQRFLGWAREIRAAPVRIGAELVYFALSGWIFLLAVAGAALSIPTVRQWAGSPQWLGPLALLAVSLYAAYRTGAEEASRGPGWADQGHSEELRSVAEELLTSVRMNSTLEYRVSYPLVAKRESLIAALGSHYPHLRLARLVVANAALRAANEALLSRCRAAVVAAGIPEPPQYVGYSTKVYHAATGEWTFPDEWTITHGPNGSAVLMSNPLSVPIDVTGRTPDELEALKTEMRALADIAPSWAEAVAVGARAQAQWDVVRAVADDLAPLSVVRPLPRGSRCNLCDPRDVQSANGGATRSPQRSIRDRLLRRPLPESEERD